MCAGYYEEIVNYLKAVKMLDDVDNDDDVETDVDVDTLLSKAHHRISIELNLNNFRHKRYEVTETCLVGWFRCGVP